MHTQTPVGFHRLVDGVLGFVCGTQSSMRGKIPPAKCVFPFLPSYLHLFPCPACFLICSMSVFVCSVLCSNFALCRYAEMKSNVRHFGDNSASVKSRPTSSTDWTYCAFIEQLQRIAEQLSAQIEGVSLLVRLFAQCFTLSCRCHPRRSIRDS
jgi:hypothetical protein